MSLEKSQLQQLMRRRNEVDETDSEGSWAISYGDMITLLLTFFILYFNVNSKPSEERNQLQQEILAEFGEEKNVSFTKPSSNVPPRMKLAEEKDGEIETRVLEDWGGEVYRDNEKIVVEFKNTTFFDFGKEDIKNASKKYLEKFAQKYIKFAGTHMLNIKAYTDTVPVKQGHRYRDNLELSALRSISAMRTLQTAGIPLSRMKLVGLGETISSRVPGSVDSVPGRKGDQFARKVVLVIEPVTKEKL